MTSMVAKKASHSASVPAAEAPPELALWPEGLNCIDYATRLSALSDYHSPWAITAADTDQVGISQLFMKGQHQVSACPVLDVALRLYVNTGEGWNPVPVLQRQCWPGGWREIGRHGNVEVVHDVFFVSGECIRSRVHMNLPTGEKAPRVAVGGGSNSQCYSYEGDAASDRVKLRISNSGLNRMLRQPHFFAFTLSVIPSVKVSRTTLRTDGVYALPDPEIDTAPQINKRTADKSLGYWIELSVPEQQQWTFDVHLCGSFVSAAPLPPAEAAQQDLAGVLARWKRQLRRVAPALADGYWQRKLTQASANLLSSTVRAEGFGNFSDKLNLLASPLEWCSTAFFWDAMIGSPTLAMIDPDLQAQVIECFGQHMDRGGLMPSFLNAFPKFAAQRWTECQAPIATWAVCKAWRCGGAEVPLARLYPTLKLLNQRWFEVADADGDGFPDWRNTGCVADNSPLYDRYRPGGYNGCFNLPAHKSVSMASYLLMDMRCLEMIAGSLGLTADVAAWQAQRRAFGARVLEELWHAEDGLFYDRDSTFGDATRVKSFFSLLPLWAGIDLSEQDARRAIERHLLNPKEFFGDVPFPSVAYNEPTFDPDGYWRGRTWPHVYFWNTEILSRFGYTREAEIARHRYLRLIASARDIPENHAASIFLLKQNGVPHYSFGTGTLVHFLLNWHQQPL